MQKAPQEYDLKGDYKKASGQKRILYLFLPMPLYANALMRMIVRKFL